MNLAGIDLNLLVVFDAIMRDRNVTRAGARLGLSQPATSNALARLRKLTNDELFVRMSGALHPTPIAIELASQIQPSLQQIDRALTREVSFDPVHSDRVFTIGMSDYTSFAILPKLLSKLQSIAPHIVIQIRSGDRAKQMALLDNGEVDIICGVFPKNIAWYHTQLLFHERYVCVCRQDRFNSAESLSLENYVAANHLLVSIAEDRIGRIDRYLAKQNMQRHIAISLPHFLVAPFILARTDLVATLPERIARSFTTMQDLQILPVPLSTEGFSVFMHWHQSCDRHPAHTWLRSLLIDIGNDL
jgi:DNA-binding transcriptional LysR family regulator